MIERLALFISHKGLSVRAFEMIIGTSDGAIRRAINNKTDIQSKWLSIIADNYHELNMRWLLTGKEEMLKNSSKTDVPVVRRTEKGGIPLIPAEAIAGIMSGDSGSIMEYDCERYEVPLFKGAEFLISVKGSSMIPKYNSGDVVACKKVTMGNFFQWNKVYVLNTEQGDLIKRIFEGSSNDTLKLVSDNPKYLPFEINKSDIYNLAIVIGVIRLE